MHLVESHIEIRASTERVWDLLTEFASYPRWNPFVRSIEGELVVGRKLSVFIQPPGSGGMRFHPTLHIVSPRRELRWKGKLLLPRGLRWRALFQARSRHKRRCSVSPRRKFCGPTGSDVSQVFGWSNQARIHRNERSVETRGGRREWMIGITLLCFSGDAHSRRSP